MIYFDNAATTYPKPKEVYDGVNYALYNYSFNAGRGSYSAAKKTFEMIDETRQLLADYVKAEKSHVVFTSSATEALNNIIYGLNLSKDDIVFVSPFEHNAIVRTLYNVGVQIKIIPFDKKTWELDESKYKDMLVLYKPKAIMISHVSNVTGFMLPYERIFELSKAFNAINILDSAQALGVYEVNPKNVDIVVFAGHKSLYAIFGIAGYINITDVNLKVYKVGGTGSDSLNLQMPETNPGKYEAGSMNSVGIYAIKCGINFLKSSKFGIIKANLCEYFIKELRKISEVVLYVPGNYITHGIVAFNIQGFSSSEVGTILAEDYDICVRTGYHCAPFVHDFIDDKNFAGCVRVSFSGFNTIEEVNTLINAIKDIV